MVPVFKNVVFKSSAAKYFYPVRLLSVGSKVSEILVNNRLHDHLGRCGLFSDFQYGFNSCHSTADLQAVVLKRIASVFNRYGATWAVVLDISKAFDRIWHAGLLQKLNSYGILGRVFSLILLFISYRWFWVVLDGKSCYEYPINVGVPQSSIIGPTLFLMYISNPRNVIYNITIYDDHTTF